MSSMLPDGIHAACLTPQTPDRQVDHERLAAHARWLLANGCDGLAILGTTGEANCFTVDERKALLEKLLASGAPADRILLGVGCCALPDTVALSRHALAHGVHNLLVLPPFYYKKVRDEGLIASFDEIIQQIGADAPRLFLYHFPQMTGVPFTLPVIEKLRAAYPACIEGIKDSGGDFANMQATLKAFPGFRVFAGTERFLLDLLRAGGAGCISATVNVTAAQAAEVYASRNAPYVDALQQRLTAARQAVEAYPMIPALKFLTERRTGDAGWRTMRPPLAPLRDEEKQALMDAVNALSPTAA
ncbi:MAG: dihydrodipicolinate synthase family protein [Rhodothermales bacterium]